MRILVCGGRDFQDHVLLASTLERFNVPGTVIITGMARGADLLAYNWANKHGLQTDCYPADWTKHGRDAGFIRNRQMLTEGKPDLVIAFPGGKGTANMVQISRDACIPVEEIKPTSPSISPPLA